MVLLDWKKGVVIAILKKRIVGLRCNSIQINVEHQEQMMPLKVFISNVAIGHAWTVLGDADKRANYDRYGIDSEASRGGQGGGGGGGMHPGFRQQGFEGELSPEDLLRMFMGGNAFGGGFGGSAFCTMC